jgi:hypothetical protein
MAQMKKKIDKNGLIWQKYIHTSSGTVTTLGNDPKSDAAGGVQTISNADSHRRLLWLNDAPLHVEMKRGQRTHRPVSCIQHLIW